MATASSVRHAASVQVLAIGRRVANSRVWRVHRALAAAYKPKWPPHPKMAAAPKNCTKNEVPHTTSFLVRFSLSENAAENETHEVAAI